MKLLTRIGCFIGVLVLVFIPIKAFALEKAHQPPDSLVQRADSLYKAFEGEQALRLYKEVLSIDSTFYPALWRTSLLYSRLGFNMKDSEQEKQFYKKSLKFAKKALHQQPDRVESHFVMGVAMGRKALIAGAKERVSASKEIKEHAESALEADSTHAGSHHLLGRWHLKLSNLNFAERLAAKWLYGGLPEGASMEKAIEHLQKATRLDPEFVIYWYDLARAYHMNGRDDQAIKVLEKALKLDPKMKSDEIYQKQAEELYYELQ